MDTPPLIVWFAKQTYRRSRPIRLWEETGKLFVFPGRGQPGIAVAIASLQNPAVFVSDTLDDLAADLNVEATGFSNGDTSGMNARLLAGGHCRDDPISGTKPFDRLLAHKNASGESEGIQPCPLVAATPGAFER